VSALVSRRLLVVAAAAAVLALGAGCASSVSPAVSVDGINLSDKQVLDEVGQWAHSKALQEGALDAQAPGTYPQALVGQIIGQRVVLELNHLQFHKLGLHLTDDDRAQVAPALSTSNLSGDDLLASFSAAYRATFTDLVAEAIAVQTQMGDAYSAWQADAAKRADIDISPKYGTWDAAQGSVTPPSGPTQPAGASDLGL
jgi:hypothetical protein